MCKRLTILSNPTSPCNFVSFVSSFLSLNLLMTLNVHRIDKTCYCFSVVFRRWFSVQRMDSAIYQIYHFPLVFMKWMALPTVWIDGDFTNHTSLKQHGFYINSIYYYHYFRGTLIALRSVTQFVWTLCMVLRLSSASSCPFLTVAW